MISTVRNATRRFLHNRSSAVTEMSVRELAASKLGEMRISGRAGANRIHRSPGHHRRCARTISSTITSPKTYCCLPSRPTRLLWQSRISESFAAVSPGLCTVSPRVRSRLSCGSERSKQEPPWVKAERLPLPLRASFSQVRKRSSYSF